MQLYGIDESDVAGIVHAYIATSGSLQGKIEIIEEKIREKYSYPLKIVIVVEEDEALVMTAYPLKGRKKQ